MVHVNENSRALLKRLRGIIHRVSANPKLAAVTLLILQQCAPTAAKTYT